MVKKVLVVAGCSHTQGSAFFIGIKNGKRVPPSPGIPLELSTPQLKKLYGKTAVTREWVSEQLTWGGKLKQLGNYDSLVNLAQGGAGIATLTRRVLKYLVNYKDLSNHTFIFQIPSPERKEFYYREKDTSFPKLASLKHLLHSNQPNTYKNPEDIKKFILQLYGKEYFEYQAFEELYILQSLLEAKNATVRLFLQPFLEYAITSIEQTTLLKRYLHPDSLPYSFLLENLNIIQTIEFDGKPSYKLGNAGLREDDHHFTEQGNTKLAEYLHENLDNTKNPN